jgi:glycosyltransferase involved in cell wall biosynthesis
MEKIKILKIFLLGEMLPMTGPATSFLTSIYKIPRDIEVHVVCRNSLRGMSFIRKEITTKVKFHPIAIPPHHLNPINKIALLVKGLLKILEVVIKERIAILDLEGHSGPYFIIMPVAVLLKKIFRVKIVYTLLGTTILRPREFGIRSKLSKTWIEWWKLFLKSFDVIVVSSEEAKKLLINARIVPYEKIKVLSLQSFSTPLSWKNYVPRKDDRVIEKFTSIRKKYKYLICFYGTTAPHRGPENLIKALPYLQDKLKRVGIIFVGTARQKDELLKLASALGVEKDCHFLGWVGKPYRLLKNSDVIVSNIGRRKYMDKYFALTFTTLEALRYGKPVVTWRAPYIEKNFSEYFILVDTENPHDIAKKISQVLKNPPLARALAKKAKRACSTVFSPKQHSHFMAKVYRDCVSDRK